MTWQHVRLCEAHNQMAECGCLEDERHDAWLLTSDDKRELACIQQFHEGYPFYGNCEAGRTGAVSTLDACKAKIERMMERAE